MPLVPIRPSASSAQSQIPNSSQPPPPQSLANSIDNLFELDETADTWLKGSEAKLSHANARTFEGHNELREAYLKMRILAHTANAVIGDMRELARIAADGIKQVCNSHWTSHDEGPLTVTVHEKEESAGQTLSKPIPLSKGEAEKLISKIAQHLFHTLVAQNWSSRTYGVRVEGYATASVLPPHPSPGTLFVMGGNLKWRPDFTKPESPIFIAFKNELFRQTVQHADFPKEIREISGSSILEEYLNSYLKLKTRRVIEHARPRSSSLATQRQYRFNTSSRAIDQLSKRIMYWEYSPFGHNKQYLPLRRIITSSHTISHWIKYDNGVVFQHGAEEFKEYVADDNTKADVTKVFLCLYPGWLPENILQAVLFYDKWLEVLTHNPRSNVESDLHFAPRVYWPKDKPGEDDCDLDELAKMGDVIGAATRQERDRLVKQALSEYRLLETDVKSKNPKDKNAQQDFECDYEVLDEEPVFELTRKQFVLSGAPTPPVPVKRKSSDEAVTGTEAKKSVRFV